MPSSIRHGDITLPLPDGWFDASQVVAVGPEENGFRPSFVVSVEPARPKETPKQLAERSLAGLKQALTDVQQVSEKQATYGGLPGIVREYTCKSGKTKIAQLQFYTVKDGIARTFTYSQLAEKIAATRTLAEMFFSSVRMGSSAEAMRG